MCYKYACEHCYSGQSVGMIINVMQLCMWGRGEGGQRFCFSLSHLLTLYKDHQLYVLCYLFFLDNGGARNKLALVQYMFDGPEIKVITKPHGNSKGSAPYFRTSDSAR